VCGVHTFTREVAVTIGVAGEEHGKNRHRVDLADLYVYTHANTRIPLRRRSTLRGGGGSLYIPGVLSYSFPRNN